MNNVNVSSIFLITVVVLVIAVAAYAILKRIMHLSDSKTRKRQTEETERMNTVSEAVNAYGQPEEVIVADPTRVENSNSVILVYDSKGFLVINGVAVPKEDIIGIDIHNVATPYETASYEIMVKIKSEELPSLSVFTGNSSVFAKDIFEQLSEKLQYRKANM